MGFTEQNVLNPKLLFLKGSNLAPESVSMLRAAKTIVLQGCDVVNTSEHTGVMAAKRATPTSATCFAAGNANMTNCAKKTGMPRISMHYFPKDETLRQKWIRFVRIRNSQERFRSEETVSFVFRSFRRKLF